LTQIDTWKSSRLKRRQAKILGLCRTVRIANSVGNGGARPNEQKREKSAGKVGGIILHCAKDGRQSVGESGCRNSIHVGLGEVREEWGIKKKMRRADERNRVLVFGGPNDVGEKLNNQKVEGKNGGSKAYQCGEKPGDRGKKA